MAGEFRFLIDNGFGAAALTRKILGAGRENDRPETEAASTRGMARTEE